MHQRTFSSHRILVFFSSGFQVFFSEIIQVQYIKCPFLLDLRPSAASWTITHHRPSAWESVSLSAPSLPGPCRFALCRPSAWVSYIKWVFFPLSRWLLQEHSYSLQLSILILGGLHSTGLQPESWIGTELFSLNHRQRNLATCRFLWESVPKSTKRFRCLALNYKRHRAPKSSCSAAT